MDYPVWEISRAQNYRLGLREGVKGKREEIKKTTSNKDIQKALFDEFIKNERDSAVYQKSRDVLKWTHDFEKANGPIDKRSLVLQNIKSVGESEIDKNSWFNISEYMGRFESGKHHIFTKEDFEEITGHFLHALEKCLFKIKNLLKQRGDDESYKAALLDPDLGQELMSNYLDDPEVTRLVESLDSFFYTLGYEYSNDRFSCKKEELQQIFYKHSPKFMELLSFVGNVGVYERIKNNKFSQARNCNFYDNLKRINILKGDVKNTCIAAGSSYGGRYGVELSSLELEALALNKRREEKKDAVMSRIYSIIHDINRVAGEDIHNTHDYCIREESNSKDGKIGHELMKRPLAEIEKKYLSFQNELAELKNKERSGVSEILSLLQNKPEPAKTPKPSKKTKKTK